MSTTPYLEDITRTMSQSRCILPSFGEHAAYGYKHQDPYAKLFEDHIVSLGIQVDDTSVDDVIAQLLILKLQNPGSLIVVCIDSLGGFFIALITVYDAAQYIRPQVQTMCLGQIVLATAVLLAAGSPDKRLTLSSIRVPIHQPTMEGAQGQASDIQVVADEIDQIHMQLEEILTKYSGIPAEQICHDIECGKIFTTAQAEECGLIDQVLTSRKGG